MIMSENKTKKMLVDEVEQQQQDKFIKAVHDLEVQHGYKLEPILQYSVTGIVPAITVVKIENVTIKPGDNV